MAWLYKRMCFALGVLALSLGHSAEHTPAGQWQVGMVDSSGLGAYSSLKFDSEGNGHVAYIVDGSHQLKYGFWDHKLKRWFLMDVDKQASFCSLTLDSKQRPHISYADFGSSREGRLHYAFWNGSAWERKVIRLGDGVAFYTSIVVDANGYPYISFYDYLDSDNDFILHMRVAHWNGQFWEVRTIDDTSGSGKFNQLATDAAGNPLLAYANVKDPNQGLRFARLTDKGWRREILDAPCYCWSVGVATDQAATPHIAYIDHANRLLKYATLSGGKWLIQTVASIEGAAYPDRTGVAIDDNGTPYISYHDGGAGSLMLAHRKAGGWAIEMVDQNRVGFTSSIAINHEELMIVYSDESGGVLKFALRSLPGNTADSK